MMPGNPRRMMHQSKPGVRRRRDSHPSIHLPRSVYLPSMKIGVEAFNKFSLGAKNSSFAYSTAPPKRSAARSMSSVKSIPLIWLPFVFLGVFARKFSTFRKGAEKIERRKVLFAMSQQHPACGSTKLAAIINHLPAKESL